VNNNPLSFNDPSGYFISSIFKALKSLFKKLAQIVKKVINVIKKVVKFIKENWRVIVAVVVAIAVPIAAGVILGGATTVTGALAWVATSASLGTVAAIGAISGGLSSLITTGSLTAAFKGAVFGAVTGAVAFGFRADNVLANTFGRAARTAKVAAHGLIGGIRAKVDGMSFSKGFLSAAVAKALTPQAVGAFKDNVFLQGIAVATIGGGIAALAGGSFEHGFLAAGLAFAANELSERIAETGIKSYSAAKERAAQNGKIFSKGVGANQDIGTNIWENDKTGEFSVSSSSPGKARYPRPHGGEGGYGEYDSRSLEGHTLKAVHIYKADPLRQQHPWFRQGSLIHNNFGIDVMQTGTMYGTGYTWTKKAGGTVWDYE
jgi:hypothetical protein